MANVVVLHDTHGYGHNTANVATFGTRFEFPEFTTDKAMRSISSLPDPANVDHWAGDIAVLKGVTKVTNYPRSDSAYDLVVIKATAFTWEELEPKIVTILEARHASLSHASQEAAA